MSQSTFSFFCLSNGVYIEPVICFKKYKNKRFAFNQGQFEQKKKLREIRSRKDIS